MRKASVIREIITYPKIAITSTFNPCDDETSLFEHVLSCGHLVTTPKPDEHCAPNCYHVARGNGTTTRRKTLENMVLKHHFYCDACVEEDAEKELPASLSCKAAEKHRIRFRKRTAAVRDKANKFRKCYIAQKFVAVPCDEEGDTVGTYDLHLSMHPFDTAWPPTGNNMFEDVEILPTKFTKLKKRQRPSIMLPDESDDEPPSAEEVDPEDVEDVDETVAEGARWLQEQEELEQRRAEERTRRRHAVARPTIISSSPDTEMSSFVVNTQTSPRNTTPTPEASKKSRDRKRTRPTQDETATMPTAKRVKKPKASPKTRSTAQTAKPQAAAHSKAPNVKKSSKRVCSIL